MSIDLNNIIQQTLQKLESEGKIEALVEKHLTETLNSVISEVFNYGSELRKALTKEVKEKARVDLAEITIPEYGKMAATIVQQALDSYLHVTGIDLFKKQVDEMLKQEVPESIKISELMEQFAREPGIAEDPLSEISFHYDTQEDRWYRFYFSKECRRSKHDCEYDIGITSAGKIFTCELNGKKIDTTLHLGGLYAFDAKLFKLYAAGTKIIPDIENVKTEYYFDEE